MKQEVRIPVEAHDRERFIAWVKHLGMTPIERKRDEPYITVEFDDPLNLYWLGCNLIGTRYMPDNASINERKCRACEIEDREELVKKMPAHVCGKK